MPLLATRFLRGVAGNARFSTEALVWLSAHEWPGNVRQLRAAVESAGALILVDSDLVDVDLLKFASGESMELPEAAAQVAAGSDSDTGALDAAIAELETRMLREAMAQASGNQSEAARRLGISRVGLIKKLARLGLK